MMVFVAAGWYYQQLTRNSSYSEFASFPRWRMYEFCVTPRCSWRSIYCLSAILKYLLTTSTQLYTHSSRYEVESCRSGGIDTFALIRFPEPKPILRNWPNGDIYDIIYHVPGNTFLAPPDICRGFYRQLSIRTQCVFFKSKSYGPVRENRRSYGAGRCGFQVLLWILRCGSVVWCIIPSGSVRFNKIGNPTVWFGAVFRHWKSYGAVRFF